MSISKRARGSLLVAAALLAMVAFLLYRGSQSGELVGSDDRAGQTITQYNPSYKRWAHPLWVPPGPEAESLLFAAQAAAGAFVLGYVIGRFRSMRK